jgi:hypothetical protein
MYGYETFGGFMAKRKIQGSLEGLLKPKVEQEQIVSVIPKELEKDLIAILNKEDLSMSKGVTLALTLFNSRLREMSVPKEGLKNKTLESILKEYIKDDNRFELSGNFIGRTDKPIHDEFQLHRKRMKLKVFEATTIAATLLIRYYKEHRNS